MSILLVALLQLSLLFPNVISTCSTTSNVEFTFYGYPDGPSDTTSFGCSGTQQVTDGTAGGDGSYAHPETFATALNNPNFVPCEIIYIPLFQKYFQYMDHCERCMEMYPATTRIDLWIGSDVNGGQKQIACEQSFGLKTGQTIVKNPPSTLKVNDGQLWDNDSGTCNDEALVFPNYSTDEAEMCSGGSSGSSPAPAPAPAPASSPAPPTSTPSTPPSTGSGSTGSGKEEVNIVNKVADPPVKAAIAALPPPPPPPPPAPTTLTTMVSSSTTSTSSTTSSSSPPSASSSSSSNDADCGVTSEFPTARPGHCVGTPCREFNDCSGALICQGWPNPVCTSPE